MVLHHGFLGYTQLRLGPLRISYFHGIDRTLTDAGHEVLVTRVHPTASIERRAAQLKRSILSQLHERKLAGQKVIVLAHSMGGLDARYMISRLNMHDRVAALATLSTPHAGTPYADWCLRNLSRTGVLRVFTHLGLDISAIKDLTCQQMSRFSETAPDVPGVRYYSISAAQHWNKIPPLLLPSFRTIWKAEGENDGLVSVRSAAFGTHLGTWPADHWHMINKRPLRRRGPDDIRPRYLDLLQQLQRDAPPDDG